MCAKYEFGEVPGTLKARLQADRYSIALERYREFIHVWEYLHKPFTTDNGSEIDAACKFIHQTLSEKLSIELAKLQKINKQWLAEHKDED